jgi:dsDNA-binding SOS-regulon protein
VRIYVYVVLVLMALILAMLLINRLNPTLESARRLPDKIDFNFHIRPILVQKCYLCHGPDPSSREAGLRLDTFEGATAFLEDSSRAIVPGDPEHSSLIGRINNKDPELVMPPPESKQVLTEREIDLVTKWMKQGAEWKPHWAFIPPKTEDIDDDVENAIDLLIREKIDERDLPIASRASKNSLIRRVSYLLTGLPPSSGEVDTFLQDESADAYEKMVDQYLNSSAFGERWARHWMDVVRYAETKGHEFDYEITGAWRYRDYLIRAFNSDVPYDQLVKEHLAGDLLPKPRVNRETGTNESHLGTAFYIFTEGIHSPVDVRQDEADRIDNMIDVTTKTFQALTVACARCHDHKFDPIKTSEYYGLFGVMESTRFSPVPAQLTVETVADIDKHLKLKEDVRKMIGDQWASAEGRIVNDRKFDVLAASHDEKKAYDDLQLLGDFRGNGLDSWKSDGFAFGKTTTLGEPVFSGKGNEIVALSDGKASSRLIGTGIFGALRSPNFTIDKDYIGVRALGKKSTIRIIIDNFQLISYPIYGEMDQKVNASNWRNFTFDVRLWKGHKAYIEILPGAFNQHVYKLPVDAFVEVQYAVAFNGKWPEPPLADTAEIRTVREVIDNWRQRKSTPQEINLLNRLLKQSVFKKNFSQLADIRQSENVPVDIPADTSAFFNGVYDGFAINSPVFIRGSYKDLSPHAVRRGFLSAIPVSDSVFNFPGSGRLQLAAAILDEGNPLTARVMINRIWHHVFGRGIVETVDNFGLQGKLPSHPELLDFLAIKFREESWSIKRMIKSMMMSETFQRAVEVEDKTTKADPDNLFLARYPVRRLEAEAIRDGILSASGQLNREMYGRPVPAHITDFMQGRGRPENSGPLDGNGRRSIYQEVRRNFMLPMMTAFDLPIPFSTFGKRDVTNVPAQALILMNDPFVHEQSEMMASNLVSQKELSLEQRIQWIYKRALSRSASESEINEAKRFIAHLATLKGTNGSQIATDLSIWKDYCHSIFNLKEFIYLL